MTMNRKFIMRNGYTKQFFWKCAAAAALSNVRSVSGYAYFVSTSSLSNAKVNHIHRIATPFSSRLYSSKKNGEFDDESLIDKMKSYIPFSEAKTKRKKSQLARKKASNDISSGIDTMLKDAPMAVRLMGKLVSPIIRKVAGTMAEAMEEQSRQLESCLDDARNLIVKDVAVRELGEPITVGRPFNQSSSSMSVNGQTQSSLQVQFEVQGSIGSGIATMSARDGKISSLNLLVNGGNYSIDVNGGGKGSQTWSSSPGLGKNKNIDSNDIIDVEFTDKVEK